MVDLVGHDPTIHKGRAILSRLRIHSATGPKLVQEIELHYQSSAYEADELLLLHPAILKVIE